MKTGAPQAFYQQQLALHTATLIAAEARIARLSRLRLFAALGAIVLAINGIRTGTAWPWWGAGAFAAVFLLLVRLHRTAAAGIIRTRRYIAIIQAELEALSGNIAAFGTGSEYIDPAHPFSYDLDLFGKRSIYQLLARNITRNGGIRLADALKDPVLEEEIILSRQETIRELSTLPQFLLDFRVEGGATTEAVDDDSNMKAWLTEKDHFINSAFVKTAAVVMPVITLGLIGYSILTATAVALLPFIVNRLIILRFSRAIGAADKGIGKTAPLVEKYRLLLRRISAEHFISSDLKDLQESALLFLPELERFSRLAAAFKTRNDTMGGLFLNYLFLYDFFCLLRLERWRKVHGNALLSAIDRVVDCDVAVSGATYAFNNPAYIFPAITANSEPPVIRGVGLRHPLLPADAIANDFILGQAEQFYLLTGANMTGKSTFMRTIGAALVLAYAGLPVPAVSLQLPLLRLFTSMRITDSVQDDISYFKAELLRIKTLMDALEDRGRYHLVFLDEPLRGTNSADKQSGTSAIIATLLQHKAIGIVATHDTALCLDAAREGAGLRNYHFESGVSEGGLTFDYTLRPGVSTSNNATLLMRQMGIVQE